MWDNLITHALYQQYPLPFFFSSCEIFILLCSCPVLSRYFVTFADSLASFFFLACVLPFSFSSYWPDLEMQQLSSWLFGCHGVRSHEAVVNPITDLTLFPALDGSWGGGWGGIAFLAWSLSPQALNQVIFNLLAYFKNYHSHCSMTWSVTSWKWSPKGSLRNFGCSVDGIQAIQSDTVSGD